MENLYICPSCNAQFKNPVNFCRYCGSPIAKTIPAAASEATPETEVETAAALTAAAVSGSAAGDDRVEENNDHPQEAGQLILETGRLQLRTLTQKDFDGLCKILQDREVMYAYEHAFSDDEVHEWLDRQIKRYRDDGFGLWAVILKETGELIGQCGITMQDATGKRIKEVGYLFAKSFWYQGYATEAALACRDYAFEKLEADEVYSIIREGNEASEKVAKRNGMKHCGLQMKHYYNMDMPHNIFKIKRETWEELMETDTRSYQKGVIDCFNEMVHAGLKRIAMSHPCKTKEERDSYLGFCNQICLTYGTFWYPEDEAFLTDLFPEELNRDTYNIIFYRVKEDLDAYLGLKKKKDALVAAGTYEGELRREIAFEFGRLLSYTEEAIERKIGV